MARNSGDLTDGGLHAPKKAAAKKQKPPDVKWKINKGESPARKRLDGKRI